MEPLDESSRFAVRRVVWPGMSKRESGAEDEIAATRSRVAKSLHN
jgi:hypothetical protein